MSSQLTLSVTTSATAVRAPADCLVVRAQQQQGSSPPAPRFKVYMADGVTLLSTQQAGVNYAFVAPPGTRFLSGQIVGYLAVVTGQLTTPFTVFADPVVAGQQLPGVGEQRVQLTITTAQLLAIQTTAILLAPAPAVGFMLLPRKLTLQFKKATTAYTIGDADNAFRLAHVGKTVSLIAPAATGLVDQTVDTIIHQSPAVDLAAIPRTSVEGLGLELKLVGTTAALTVGNGSVIATLDYVVIPLQ